MENSSLTCAKTAGSLHLPAARVVRVLEQLGEVYGLQETLRLDNSPEPHSTALTEWCEDRSIEHRYIKPGKPSQNAFIEQYNRTYRHKFLDAYLFSDLDQVQEITEEWIKDYNEDRPDTANGKLPLVQNWQHPKPADFSAIRLST